MGKEVRQPNFEKKRYITSFLFKLKSKPAALYQSLGGFAINGVNLTKLQSYPEQNSFESYFFLCDLRWSHRRYKSSKIFRRIRTSLSRFSRVRCF